MTGAEWLAGTDTQKMLRLIRNGTTDRKARLFAVACCRRDLDRLGAAGLRVDMELEEWLADAVPRSAFWDEGELWMAMQVAIFAADRNATFRDDSQAADDLCRYLRCIFGNPCPPAVGRLWPQLAAALAGVVKVIAGSPHRPNHTDAIKGEIVSPLFMPEWRTSTSVALARGIYDERAFDRLPILADALEEADCDNADVLAHCRSGGPHVRGCWVVDLVLGKE